MRYILSCFVLAAALVAAATASAMPRVVTTTSDLAALARVVAGDLATIESVIPPAVDPEAFEPRPGDLDRIKGAAILVRVGLGYDHWLDKLLYQIDDPRLFRRGPGYVDASLAIPLLEVKGQPVVSSNGHAHGIANPHYWLDPENAVIITANIAEALIRALPEDKERIVANRNAFLAELKKRLANWHKTLDPFEGAKFLAYHNSWPYLARRFRFDVVDFVEPREGVAPSPSHLAKLIGIARREKIHAIFHEPYEPPDASHLIADRAGIPFVLLATSVGSLPQVNDYLTLIDYDIGKIAATLGVPSR